MKMIRFEEKEYDIKPVGLKERTNIMRKYKDLQSDPNNIDTLEKVYDDLITLICQKTNNVLTRDLVVEKANEDATKADDLLSQFMDLMIGDLSKKK